MTRQEISEFHYIAPLDNLLSIFKYGILSHKNVKKIEHDAFGWLTIQDRRANVRIPGGRKLHEYVNLYFTARNPTLCKKQDLHMNLCILRIATQVLDLSNVIITDQNASSEYCRFSPASTGLSYVNKEWTFAKDWTDSDQITYFRKKSAKCAEILVPDCIEPKLILGAYVSCAKSLLKFDQLNVNISAVIDKHLFFQD